MNNHLHIFILIPTHFILFKLYGNFRDEPLYFTSKNNFLKYNGNFDSVAPRIFVNRL